MVNQLPSYVACGLVLFAGLAEWLHYRRTRRVARLAFGPAGAPRSWVRFTPFARMAALGLLGWGLTALVLIAPRPGRHAQMPEGGYRHLVLALDVSPSMQLADAGPERKQRRAQRASEVLMSVFNRIALDQVRISVVAFYNGAKPVVVDTYDLEVVRNIISDLPLDYAFEIGKTKLMEGVREAAALARPWQPGSTTLMLVSDGDTLPDTGMPELPRSIGPVLIVGVGDPRAGTYIDGHQSRQDTAVLRQLAQRLRGVYHDANEKHLPSEQILALTGLRALRDVEEHRNRDAALGAVAVGALILAGLPLALAVAGSPWQAGHNSSRARAGDRMGIRRRAGSWIWRDAESPTT